MDVRKQGLLCIEFEEMFTEYGQMFSNKVYTCSRCSSRRSDYKDPPSRPPPLLENPLNNVLVQQMFAKMKNFATYGGIK